MAGPSRPAEASYALPDVHNSQQARIRDMPATFITWKEFYSVGCQELDDQHQQVLGIINDLYGALQGGREREEIKGLLDRLVQYTEGHFQREEELMEERGYPDAAQHRTVHEQMTQKTVDLRKRFGAVRGQDLLVFLKEWWVNHICGADKQYSPYMEAVTTG
jgi:hemerythrin